MVQWTFRKVMVCLLTVFVTLGLNLPTIEVVAAPIQSQAMTTINMPSIAMKGVADSGSKGGCPHCPDMGGVPALNCGLPFAPLLADNGVFEFRQTTPFTTTYVIAELALKGRSFAPETGPPRTLSHV